MIEVLSPSPRDGFALEGAEAQERDFLDAMSRGRLHHAWLLTGPEGVGKATFAFRAARRLLGARPDPALGLLGSSPGDPVSHQVSARSHPDFMVLERATLDGKPRKSIPVDEARQLPEFFSKAPATSAYRVAIIDTADDLNVNAANAVLKTLEEPPERGVLLLVSNAPGKLLPTIRSRCRRLAFTAWGEARTSAWLGERGFNPEDALRLSRMSRGAPGRALFLAGAGALDADRAAHDLLRKLPQTDDAALQAMADGFRGAEGAARFEVIFDRLADHVRLMAEETAVRADPGSLERWAEAWESLTNLPGEAEALNLDRADVFWTALRQLRQAARAG
jgi:DNA polymerase-3 subunit delta'